jgi:SPP1 family predicted phage head-tail adaptor
LAKCTSVAATFRHRLTIQNETKTPDGQGGFTSTWTDGATIWASIDPIKAFERYQAMQAQTPITHKIMTRYTSEITSASRLKFGTRIFWVQEVIDPEERQRFLTIKTIERS